MSKIALFIFRRDLRIFDNTALNTAISEGYKILPVFIFTPEQIDKNKYFSKNAVQFMIESLLELSSVIGGNKLLLIRGENIEVIGRIYKHIKFQAIFTNLDYTPYAVARDGKINKWCKDNSVVFRGIKGDYELIDQSILAERDGRPYTVLSAYFARFVKHYQVKQVVKLRKLTNFISSGMTSMTKAELTALYAPENRLMDQRGGRSNGLKGLARLTEMRKYATTRDKLSNTNGTTHLSAHLKFGTISIRELYWRIRKLFKNKSHPLIRELVFRDFYVKVYSRDPELLANYPRAFDHAVDKRIQWRKTPNKYFKAWCKGQTGFPIVDAGIRQLLTTGYMHNRARMIVASVLSKYFLIDWRLGALFFAQHLVDYDPISNTAGWGFSTSTGVDAQPWFRAPFNPFLQSKKFDADAAYIKRWVPELEAVPAADIHRWYKACMKYKHIKYPPPIVDYNIAAKNALRVYAPKK